MSRRIEIELTSARPDGTWTWRVAGAKQPRGVLDGGLLPAATKVGDVLRADADFELEGTVIVAVAPPPEKHAPDLLKFVGDGRPFEGVTTSLVSKSPRRTGDDRGRRDRGDRPERRDGPDRRPARAEGREPARPEGSQPARPEGRPPARTEGRPPTKPRAPRPDGRRPERRVERADSGAAASGAREDARPSRPRRFTPASTHRTAVLETLAPEERAVAEQLLNGGVPAVRRALQEQNARAREEGRPEIKADALLTLAEELLPRLKSAEWRDRAEEAVKEADQLALRDLRSVVAGADAAARDDESRILAKTLRETLDQRETAEREAWVADVTNCLDEGRVARALRVAGRPPDPRTRFPAELSARLADAASEALGPETPRDRWGQVLSAVLDSPVRRAVKPRGLPPEPGDTLLAAARQAAGRVPALAPLLGLKIPPPPGPPHGAPRPVRSPGAPPRRRIPPKPVAPPAAERIDPSTSEAGGEVAPSVEAAPPPFDAVPEVAPSVEAAPPAPDVAPDVAPTMDGAPTPSDAAPEVATESVARAERPAEVQTVEHHVAGDATAGDATAGDATAGDQPSGFSERGA
ncbi:MAG: hypothetical protein ACYDH6_17865 [Acidimicrobiales bacterium]